MDMLPIFDYRVQTQQRATCLLPNTTGTVHRKAATHTDKLEENSYDELDRAKLKAQILTVARCYHGSTQ